MGAVERRHNPTVHPETQHGLTLKGDRGKDELTEGWCSRGEAELVGLCGNAAVPDRTLNIPSEWQPRQPPRLHMLGYALRLAGLLHGHWGILLFQGRLEFILLPLLTRFPKAQRRTQSSSITSWVRWKRSAACKIPPLRQERGNVCKYFLLPPRTSQIGRVGACAHFYWGFSAVLLENHSWLPMVWDTAESDLKHVNVTRIMITNLAGTLYAIQVHLRLQPPWIWICFLILMLSLVLSGIYSTIFLLQYFSNSF